MTVIVPVPIYVHRVPSPRRRPAGPDRVVPRPWPSKLARGLGAGLLALAALGFLTFVVMVVTYAVWAATHSYWEAEPFGFMAVGLGGLGAMLAFGSVGAVLVWSVADYLDVDPFPAGRVETWGVYRTDNGELVHTFEHNSGEPAQLLYETALREIGYKVEMPGTGSADGEEVPAHGG